MAGVSFVSTVLLGTNKVGDLKPDDTGYYDVVLGAFETANAHGHYYTFEEQTRRLFESSSSFMRQISEGTLWGEWGHPKRAPGERLEEFLRRCVLVNEKEYAFHIRRVDINERDVKDKAGRNVVAVIGQIKPMGPYGPALKEVLDTRDANACFSVRAQTDDFDMGGGKERRSVKNIITWDYVGDPGVPPSSKYNSPKLEDYYSQYVDFATLEKLRKEVKGMDLKMESNVINQQLDTILGDYRSDIFGGSKQQPRSRML